MLHFQPTVRLSGRTRLIYLDSLGPLHVTEDRFCKLRFVLPSFCPLQVTADYLLKATLRLVIFTKLVWERKSTHMLRLMMFGSKGLATYVTGPGD